MLLLATVNRWNVGTGSLIAVNEVVERNSCSCALAQGWDTMNDTAPAIPNSEAIRARRIDRELLLMGWALAVGVA